MVNYENQGQFGICLSQGFQNNTVPEHLIIGTIKMTLMSPSAMNLSEQVHFTILVNTKLQPKTELVN